MALVISWKLSDLIGLNYVRSPQSDSMPETTGRFWLARSEDSCPLENLLVSERFDILRDTRTEHYREQEKTYIRT